MKKIIVIHDFFDKLKFILVICACIAVIILYLNILLNNFNLLNLICVIILCLFMTFILWAAITNKNNKIKKIEIDDNEITISYIENGKISLKQIDKQNILQCEFVINITRNMRELVFNSTLNFINKNKEYIHFYHTSTQPEAIRKIFSISKLIPISTYRIYDKDCPITRKYLEQIALYGKPNFKELLTFIQKNLKRRKQIHIIFAILLCIFVFGFFVYSVFLMR